MMSSYEFSKTSLSYHEIGLGFRLREGEHLELASSCVLHKGLLLNTLFSISCNLGYSKERKTHNLHIYTSNTYTKTGQKITFIQFVL